MKSPDFKPVKSTNIAALAHHDGALFVKFNSGAVWKYAGVTPEAYQEMLTAPSIGSHFARFVKPKHQGVAVPAEPAVTGNAAAP